MAKINLSDLLRNGGCDFDGVAIAQTASGTQWEHIAGLADREKLTPNRLDTSFQIASISKQFAAAAVLLLQEESRLNVGDALSLWIPNCPNDWGGITLHHLLTHNSGIGHWGDYPHLSLFNANTPAEVVRTIQNGTLVAKPGSRWSYSSPAYVLVSHVVELASKRPYGEFLREAIFEPLKMAHTRAGQRSTEARRESVGYYRGAPVPSFELDTVGIGAGDVWSTASDMTVWDRSLLSSALLSPESIRQMFTPFAAARAERDYSIAVGYGYGWFIESVSGHRVAHHLGGNAGFVAFNAIALDDNVSLVMLSNDECFAMEPAGIRIMGALLDGALA
jgi:CubicO group peptidase (beta-lactamase class C family)